MIKPCLDGQILVWKDFVYIFQEKTQRLCQVNQSVVLLKRRDQKSQIKFKISKYIWRIQVRNPYLHKTNWNKLTSLDPTIFVEIEKIGMDRQVCSWIPGICWLLTGDRWHLTGDSWLEQRNVGTRASQSLSWERLVTRLIPLSSWQTCREILNITFTRIPPEYTRHNMRIECTWLEDISCHARLQ